MGFNSAFKGLIQINHQPDATVFQLIILTFVYSSTCFGRFPAHHQELNDCSGSLWFYLHIVVIVVLCSWSGRPAGPTTNKNTIQKYNYKIHVYNSAIKYKLCLSGLCAGIVCSNPTRATLLSFALLVAAKNFAYHYYY